MTEWTKFEDKKPDDFKLVEVAKYAGRAQLVYNAGAGRFLDVVTHSEKTGFDVWRTYTPPAAPAKLELGGTRFIPNPELDEPSFLLVARDPVMPALLEGWAYLRQGPTKMALARHALGAAMSESRTMEPQHSGDPQIIAAFRIAQEARDWQRRKALAS